MTHRSVPAAFLALGVLLLAGCVALPDAARPEEPGVVWTTTDASVWVLRHEHCGFGMGPDHACEVFTALHRDGAVLDFTFGRGAIAGEHPEGVWFADPADATYRGSVEGMLQQAGIPLQGQVHDLHARRMDPNEREDILRVVEHALRQAEPLPEPDFSDCLDCGGLSYWAFGRPRLLEDQRWGPQPPADDAWVLLEEQMGILRTWVAA